MSRLYCNKTVYSLTFFKTRIICHFDTARIDTKNTHGTGCTFSSAVASQLARGMGLREAVQKAKDYVTMAIGHSLDIGKGCGPTHHFWHLYQYGLQEGMVENET